MDEPIVPIIEGSGDFNAPYAGEDRTTGPFWISAPPAVGELLAPCPFCGCDYPSTEREAGLEVCNTHAPYFWVRCNACGCEQHAEFEPPAPIKRQDGAMVDGEQAYILGRAAAVLAWNTRDQRWRTRPACDVEAA